MTSLRLLKRTYVKVNQLYQEIIDQYPYPQRYISEVHQRPYLKHQLIYSQQKKYYKYTDTNDQYPYPQD